ncbi:hypothetical protein HY638_00280 [Candidatus Woesearchaeota archaeon]|nr:hypothetical protein [Candidatus Woesearchaeota archaeon]
MKKGDVTIQFNWILVLIAGAVILVFFAGVIRFASKSSEDKTNLVVLNALGSISSSIKSGQNLDKPIESIPEAEIKYECVAPSCSCSLGIGGRALDLDPTLIVFAPSRMETPTLLAKSLSWESPFWVANFLYITSTSIRYVFVYDGSSLELKELIMENLPSRLKKEEIDVADAEKFKGKNDKGVKVVFIGVEPADDFASALKSMSDEDVNAVKISGNDRSGSVSYYQKKEDSWEPANEGVQYIGLPSLIGSIFIDESGSEETSNFECVERKSFETLKYVDNAHIARAGKIRDIYDSGSSCSGIYIRSLESLGGLYSAVKDPYKTGMDVMVQGIMQSSESLRAENEEALLYSCALIY